MNPAAYLAEIREKPCVISCCPETDFKPYDTGEYDLKKMHFIESAASDPTNKFWIDDSFTWSDSPQGLLFWCDKANKHKDGQNIGQPAFNAITDMIRQNREEKTIHGR
jgi:hypothetical protein